MSTFVEWIAILFALRAVVGTILLASGRKAKYTPGSMAFRVLMNGALAAWGIYLLAKASA